MAISMTLYASSTINGEVLGQPVATSSGSLISVDEPIADSTTNGLIAFTLDVSQLKALFMMSDQDVLLETNDGTSPDDSFALKANEPVIWHANSPLPNPFASGTDVTGLYATNASGATAAVQIRALVDPTA